MDRKKPRQESAAQTNSAVSPDQIVTDRFVRAIIRRKARLILRCFIDGGAELRDVEQELILRLLQNLKDFDPAKGHLKAFISVVIERLSGMMIRERMAKKRSPGTHCSLDKPRDDSRAIDLPDCEHEHDQLLVDRARDVAEVIAQLPPELRDLARRLQTRTVSEAARDRNMSRSSLQRHVERLKRYLEDAGLKIYLD